MRVSDRALTLLFLWVPITWAGSFIAGTYVVADIDPVSSVFWRFALSAIVMLPGLVLLHRKAHPKLLEPGYLLHLAVVVLIGGIAYHLLFFWGLGHASPTNAALIIALNPFFTTIGEIVVFKRARAPRFYLGFALALAGAFWVILARGDGITPPGLGELLCLIASLTWSAYTIAAKLTKDERWDPLWVNAYGYLITAVLLLPFVWTLLGEQIAGGLSTAGWLSIWYMAIFPTAIGYTVFYVGVQRRGPAWASAFIYLVPPLTAHLDNLFFGAAFTLPMVVGTTLVVIGLAIGNLDEGQVERIRGWARSITSPRPPGRPRG